MLFRLGSMTFSKTMRIAPLAAALLCASSVAQTRFCMGGDLAHLSAAEKASCSAKLQAVKTAAASFHVPDDWHFIMVCGEDSWKDYTAFAMNDTLMTASADTHFEQHETFLRGDRFDLTNAPSLRRAVAREVAGIVLRSHDELAINNQVDLWMSGSSERSGL